MSFIFLLVSTVLGKNPPGKKPPPPDSKPNPIPNLTPTLLLTPHGGFFPGGFCPDTSFYISQIISQI